MFTYTLIFLVSLLVAVGARVLYKSMANASGSVYNTKLPDAELAHLETPVKRKTKTDEGINTAYPTDLRDRGTYAYLADTQDTRVAEEAPQEWPQSVHHVPVDHGLVNENDGHCSLYQDNIEEPALVQEPKASWPQPENKPEKAGKAYKVSGKVAVANSNLETDAKPWGW